MKVNGAPKWAWKREVVGWCPDSDGYYSLSTQTRCDKVKVSVGGGAEREKK